MFPSNFQTIRFFIADSEIRDCGRFLLNFFAEMFHQYVTFSPPVFLFRRTPDFDESFNVENLKDAPIDFGRIRCPWCRWQPKASSRWFCADDNFHFGCGTIWNTFDTRGVCPGCQYQWKQTDCLRCYRASPHEEWYEDSE